MKADVSRIRFDQSKNYTTVVEQQGRVALDADANEQRLIDAYQSGTRLVDVVGEYGCPVDDAGFHITVPDIVIGAGRYYVAGLLCENQTSLTYEQQTYLSISAPAEEASALLSQLQTSNTAPSGLTVAASTTGGTFAAGTYFWTVTATNTAGETVGSNEATTALTGTTASATLKWTQVPGATGYKVYRGMSAGHENTLVTTIATGSTVTYTDTGVAGTAATPPTTGPVLQVYLQVWERLQTALDDPDLREPAIGNADTTARLQTVWRVLAELADAIPPPPVSTGTMTAETAPAATDCGCGPVAVAGYQGVENQLYRVEIHTQGNQTQATFKWSRENGSVVVAVTSVNGSTIEVSSLGPDANLGFQVGQWVELTDDIDEFGFTPNAPGTLYQIQSIASATSVTLTLEPGQTITVQQTQNARMRRWDQSGSSATTSGLALSAGTWIALENGIQVNFSAGNYQSGDYWTIPARAAAGQIDWPPPTPAGPVYLAPTSIQVYNAPLATISFLPGQPAGSLNFRATDTRPHFSPLTAITPPAVPTAIHVAANGISWVNDQVMTLDQLAAKPITITLDQAPTSPITAANFIVTVEAAVALTPNATPSSTTFLRAPTVVQGTQISTSGPVLSWALPKGGNTFLSGLLAAIVEGALDEVLAEGASGQQWALVRVRLVGPMIYTSDAAGQPVYLDGRAFGRLGTQPSGTPRNDLILPSGSGAVASDFDGWFYLAPTLQVASVVLNYPSVTVQSTEELIGGTAHVTGVTDPSGDVVTPTATVNLNYPALAAATVSLTLQPAQPTTATIQSTAAIAVGQASVTVPITVVGNPGVGANNAAITVAFTVSAILVGQGGSAQAPFTVVGSAPKPFVVKEV